MKSLRLLALAPVLLLPFGAAAERDWFASLYTSDGVELRNDERVFAVYALLNAMGYDEAPVLRRLPVLSREMDPVRLKLRSALKVDPGLEGRLNGFFDQHPQAAEAYARYALSLGGSGGFDRTGMSPADLKGLESLLAEGYGQGKLAELFALYQDEYRAALKGYHAAVDGPVGAVRRLLRVKEDEPPRVVLVVNLLDARGTSWSATVGEELYVVLGPSRSPDVFAVAQQLARAKLAPLVEGAASSIKPLAEVAAAAELSGPAELVLEALSRAVAAAALQLPEAELEARSRGAFAPVRELAKAVDGFGKSDKPLDALLAEAVAVLSKDQPKEGAGHKAPKGK